VNIQFKADINGAQKVLEVNTRAAGGFSYSAAAGINLGHDCLKMMHGEKVSQVSLDQKVSVKPVNVTLRLS
jgi:predicted ATP-grasp superfamily ATP-dependent carboligase